MLAPLQPGGRRGRYILISDIVGINPRTGTFTGDTIRDQTRQALTNCEAILEVGVLLANPADFAGLNEEYSRCFPSDPPARYVAKQGADRPDQPRPDPQVKLEAWRPGVQGRGLGLLSRFRDLAPGSFGRKIG
jgi:2-iminobutanoate/2-iminopropanoate deaminase